MLDVYKLNKIVISIVVSILFLVLIIFLVTTFVIPRIFRESLRQTDVKKSSSIEKVIETAVTKSLSEDPADLQNPGQAQAQTESNSSTPTPGQINPISKQTEPLKEQTLNVEDSNGNKNRGSYSEFGDAYKI